MRHKCYIRVNSRPRPTGSASHARQTAIVFVPTIRSTALRESWGASDRRPVLLYVGRVSTEKGLDLLPALTERLQRSQITHRLVIVGDGPMRRALSDRCTRAIFTGTLSPPEARRRDGLV